MMNDCEKPALRKHLRKLRAALSREEREKASLVIAKHLCTSLLWQQAVIVHCYQSFATEVSTEYLFQAAFDAGKRIIVPITPNDAESELLHAEIFSQTLFRFDKYGIAVPTPETSRLCTPMKEMTKRDCVIVPLLGFDAACNRIGYGKGYYDRFLGTFPTEAAQRPIFIGIAFELQCIEQGIISESYDIGLDCTITEQMVRERTSQ